VINLIVFTLECIVFGFFCIAEIFGGVENFFLEAASVIEQNEQQRAS